MNKSVGIITLGNSINYGGVLQAAAMSHTLKRMGVTPVFITHQKMECAWYNPLNHVKLCMQWHQGLDKIRLLGSFVKTLMANRHIITRKKKINCFQKFINDNMKTTPYYATKDELELHCGMFNYYITGSDQVWNNEFKNNRIDYSYFLDFISSNKHKFSYAASVGGYKNDTYIKKIIELTKAFEGISVRERSLAEQMKKLGAKNVEVVLDPTLLLDRNDWISMEQVCDIPKHFILVYYLEKSELMDRLVMKTAKKYCLPVVDILPGFSKLNCKVQRKRTIGPAEFIYLFHHADYIITNSFHGTVFSILFQKPFLTVARKGQETRMVDFLNEINLSDHLRCKEDISSLGVEIPYNKVKQIIEEKKYHSLKFLKKMLEMEF